MSAQTFIVTRSVTLQLPTVPNYIIHVVPPRRRQDGFSEAPKTDVADLSDEEIDAIGKAWLEALRARAYMRRQAREEPRHD